MAVNVLKHVCFMPCEVSRGIAYVLIKFGVNGNGI